MRRVLSAARSVRGRITIVATVLIALTLTGASFAIVRLVENDLVSSAEDALDEALEQAAEVSGVSIDEETINLISYQQQYQAAARLISTVDELTQILIGLV